MISAKVIAHSKCAITGQEIITFELVYQRFIHSELMTHREFSRNAASSRAIPVAKMIEMVRSDFAAPINWGKNMPGMQAKEELSGCALIDVKGEWAFAASNAADSAEFMESEGAHKQIVNRILEPFQWIKTVVTSTSYTNWDWLRDHTDAQPEIKQLAVVMKEARANSVPMLLQPGEWHVPYVHRVRATKRLEGDSGPIEYWLMQPAQQLTLKEALQVSSSCCAQVSYRLLDDSLNKAQDIYNRLVDSEPVHASPFEHQATPIAEEDNEWGGTIVNVPAFPLSWEEGITHSDREGNLWSGNFKGFIQHRQLIPNNVRK